MMTSKISNHKDDIGTLKSAGIFIGAVWELARLHDPLLTLLAWYPIVWTTSLAIHTSLNLITAPKLFAVLFKNYVTVALTHSTCCTLNDILDRNVDGHVPRTASRPLPSGRISLSSALAVWLAWATLTLTATAQLTPTHLSPSTYLILWTPAWVLSSVYPLAKRYIDFPQIVLGSACICVLLPAWAQFERIGEGGVTDFDLAGTGLVCISVLVMTWIIYIDMFYATMDSAFDAAAGVKSLSVKLAPNISRYFIMLATLQLSSLSVYAFATGKSPWFWVGGVAVWVMNNVWHIRGLRVVDGNWQAGSGGTIFRRNIGLGAWLCVVEVIELWVQALLVM